MYTVVNVNSPLLYDGRMLDALLAYAAAGQPVIVTPFLLMGAMSPVSIPAALVQQTAEALAGVALTQLVRPGTPVILGSFLSHTDMQSGSPGFGGPESAIGLFASGQIARRLGLPWRSGGGSLTSSQLPDAQAAYEGLNTMLPGVPRRRELRHAHRGLAGVRASCRATRSSSSTSRSCARCARSSRRSRWTRRASPTARTRRSGTAVTSSARSTRSSASATASTGRCSRAPRTSSAGSATAAATAPSARRRSGRPRSSATSDRRWTPTCESELGGVRHPAPARAGRLGARPRTSAGDDRVGDHADALDVLRAARSAPRRMSGRSGA